MAPSQEIEITQRIRLLRGHRVLIDSDLAALYGVTTARLNQQFRRNRDRFPPDFAFEIAASGEDSLMLHFATSKPGRGGRRKPVIAFTEHGAMMVAPNLRMTLRPRPLAHMSSPGIAAEITQRQRNRVFAYQRYVDLLSAESGDSG